MQVPARIRDRFARSACGSFGKRAYVGWRLKVSTEARPRKVYEGKATEFTEDTEGRRHKNTLPFSVFSESSVAKFLVLDGTGSSTASPRGYPASRGTKQHCLASKQWHPRAAPRRHEKVRAPPLARSRPFSSDRTKNASTAWKAATHRDDFGACREALGFDPGDVIPVPGPNSTGHARLPIDLRYGRTKLS